MMIYVDVSGCAGDTILKESACSLRYTNDDGYA